MVVEPASQTVAETAPPVKLKNMRRILFAAFFVLLIAMIFVGLKLYVGYVLGYLAAISLVLALTCRWQKIRYFLILMGVSAFVTIFISMIYVEVLLRMMEAFFGQEVFNTTGWRIFDVVLSNIIVFFAPAIFLVSVTGSLVLYINRLVTKTQKGT